MRLGLTDDQETIKEVFGGFFAKESPTKVVRAAEPGGFDPDLWRRASETGAPGMGVAEAAGGGGASLVDLAVVAEEFGRAIAPIPLIDHQVAARALAVAGHASNAVTDGATVATLALRPARNGSWRLVPAGAVAGVVVGLDGDELVAVQSTAPNAGPTNHGAQPLADRSTSGDRTVLATGAAAQQQFTRALSEWKTLTISGPRRHGCAGLGDCARRTYAAGSSSVARSARSRRCNSRSPICQSSSTAGACLRTRRPGPATTNPPE